MKIHVTRSAVSTAATVVPTPWASRIAAHVLREHGRPVRNAVRGSHGAEASTRELGGRAHHAPGTIMERHSRGSGGRTASHAGLHFTHVNAPNAVPE